MDAEYKPFGEALMDETPHRTPPGRVASMLDRPEPKWFCIIPCVLSVVVLVLLVIIFTV